MTRGKGQNFPPGPEELIRFDSQLLEGFYFLLQEELRENCIPDAKHFLFNNSCSAFYHHNYFFFF